MSSLEPRRGGGMSRRQREQRGYQLVVAGGISGVVTVVGGLLAIFGVIGWGLPLVALVVAGFFLFLFPRAGGPALRGPRRGTRGTPPPGPPGRGGGHREEEVWGGRPSGWRGKGEGGGGA